MKDKKFSIPLYVRDVCRALTEAGFEAYLVGGCVRDLVMERTPKDWDVATNALPEEVQKNFPDSFYENEFGTVGVKTTAANSKQQAVSNAEKKEVEGNASPTAYGLPLTASVVEVTTYRTEAEYSDKRRPDSVEFVNTIEEDLARRDFTMNAIALEAASGKRQAASGTKNSVYDLSFTTCSLLDPYGGQTDIQNKLIRAVGDPEKRFGEDALRMMRAVRFHSELGFEIEEKTLAAIQKHSASLEHIARERVRTELERIILSARPSEGIEMLHKTGLLRYIIPELEEGIGVAQNLHHIYTVWEHNIRALKTCPSGKLSVRLAALLHDVAKPRTKRGEGKYATFYNHDHMGGRMVRAILSRLTFPREVVEHSALLVDQHLFYYNVDEVTEAAVRRVVARVGRENIGDLIAVRIGDRLGSGVPKAKPYRLRHFEFMVEKISSDPVSVKQLAINGSDLIKELAIQPGPKIGAILDVLLGEVIDDAAQNTKENLLTRAQELQGEELDKLRTLAKDRIRKQQEEEERVMKERYFVK